MCVLVSQRCAHSSSHRHWRSKIGGSQMLQAVCLTCLAMMVLRKSRTLRAQSYAISVYFQICYLYKVTRQQQQVTDERQHGAFVCCRTVRDMSEEGEKQGRKCPLTRPESKTKSGQENLRGSVGTGNQI